MNIHKLNELIAALIELEGDGIASCWNGSGEYTLSNAIAKYNDIPENERAEYSGWYECIYGNGGFSRYFVNMVNGEVTFSAYHSYPTKTAKAESLGFNLH